ncbi:MAG: 6-bladed beta-propeller, partial [Candidatus Delongbacteria bacterium]|nr:6-bladed beta-propeller [Candidatus Delongbacteria bacterium]
MKRIIILAIILVVFLFSCSKNEKNYTVSEINGIKLFSNKNIPSDSTFKITPKELYTIELNENNPDTALSNIGVRNLCIDKNKNVYMLDTRRAMVHKVDSQGKYVTSFGNKGTGPGEMTMPLNIAVMSDTLYVFDYAERKTNIFDLDGNFVKADFIASNAFFYSISGVNDECFTGILALDRYGDEGVYTVYQVPIYKRNSTPYKELYNREEILQPPNDRFFPQSFQPSYAVGHNKIYLLENSQDTYKISVFDPEGVNLYNLRKNYRKLRMKEIDVEEHGELGLKFLDILKFKNVSDQFGLHVTKDDYLLVKKSIDRTEENKYDYIVDAFKDGVFINSFNLGIGKAYDYSYGLHKRWFL